MEIMAKIHRVYFRDKRLLHEIAKRTWLAREHGLDPAQMALAFVTAQPFVTSNILGATSLEQLEANLMSSDLVLGDEVLAGIEAIHKTQPNPAP